MKSDDIVPLLTGKRTDDLGFRQGQLLAWDPSTESNTVLIAGQEFTDLPVLAVGTIAVSAGDLVGVLRFKSTYLILGRIAPAGSGSLQIRSALVSDTDSKTSTSYGDLAHLGPQVTAYVGGSRQCLVMISAATAQTSDFGLMGVEISGASSIAVDPIKTAFLGADTGSIEGTAAAMFQYSAADELNEGLNVFTAKYATTRGTECFWRNRLLTVFPY